MFGRRPEITPPGIRIFVYFDRPTSEIGPNLWVEFVRYSRKWLIESHNFDQSFKVGAKLELDGEHQAAEELFRAIAGATDCPSAKLNLAITLRSQGRVDEAAAMMTALLENTDPRGRFADLVRYNLAWHLLRDGHFRQGMLWTCLGRRLGLWGSLLTAPDRPLLEPNVSLAGKTVLMVGEGGFGDQVLAIRFARTIQARGGSAVWMGPRVDPLLSRAIGLDSTTSVEGVARLHYDYWAPCMDLPCLLGLDSDELPVSPYLSVDHAYMQRWSTRVNTTGRLRVGLRWQGNPGYQLDRIRTIPFTLLERLTNEVDADFYSLQRDAGMSDLSSNSKIVNLGSELQTWDDTAAAISQLDIVISSCTAIAHVAAALGKEVWVLTPIYCYYPWATRSDRTHWYSSVRIFRQTRARAWDTPIAQMTTQLKIACGQT